MDGLKPGAILDATAATGRGEIEFRLKARIDNRAEMDYLDSGGVLPYVLSRLAS
jgi:aconitase A